MTDVSEISDVNLDAAEKILTFKVKEGYDIQGKLTELASSINFFEDYAIN